MKEIEKPRCDGCFYWDTCPPLCDEDKTVIHGICKNEALLTPRKEEEDWCGQWRDKNAPFFSLNQKIKYYQGQEKTRKYKEAQCNTAQ
jgi:hypothetical protein